jgi:serine/threonine-protein kinase
MDTQGADVPAGLQQVIDRCLKKRPEDRYHNVGELAADLITFAASRFALHAHRASSVLGRRELPSVADAEETNEATPLPPAVPRNDVEVEPSFAAARGGRRNLWLGVAVSSLALAGAVAWLSSGGAPPSAPVEGAPMKVTTKEWSDVSTPEPAGDQKSDETTEAKAQPTATSNVGAKVPGAPPASSTPKSTRSASSRSASASKTRVAKRVRNGVASGHRTQPAPAASTAAQPASEARPAQPRTATRDARPDETSTESSLSPSTGAPQGTSTAAKTPALLQEQPDRVRMVDGARRVRLVD